MVHPIVSHTTYIAVGIIATIMIVGVMFSLQENTRNTAESLKVNYYAMNLENKILELSSLSSDNFEAQIKMSLPENYLVRINGNILSVSGEEFEATRELPINGYGGGYSPIYLIFRNNEVIITEGAEVKIIEPIEIPPAEIEPTPIIRP